MLCDRHWIFCSTASIHLKAQICSTVLTVEAYIELWTILLFITLITKYPQSSNDFPSANTIATGKWTEWWLVNRFFIELQRNSFKGSVSTKYERSIDGLFWGCVRVVWLDFDLVFIILRSSGANLSILVLVICDHRNQCAMREFS